jgi:outer membrane immunogenic protein
MISIFKNAVAVLALSTMMSAAWADEYNPDDYPDAPASEPVADSSSGGWAYDWGGGYFGLNAGYAMGQHDTLGVGGIDTGSRNLRGNAFGAAMGHNYQISRIVFGTEMDFTKSAISGNFDLPGSPIACDTPGFKCTTDVNWYGSFRGRAGFAVDNIMPYVTAGLAVGGVNSTFTGPAFDTNVSGLGVGWVLGAGLEYALMKNLTVRGEVLHYDLNDVTQNVIGSKVKIKTNYTVLRTGVSLKF